jgi:cell division inhibitor SepF
MANFLDKMLNMVGWSEAEAEEEEIVETPIRSLENKQPIKKVVSMNRGTTSTLNILYPESFEEARLVCNNIRENIAVIVNLENMKKDLGQRIVDFISGAVFALDGSITKISNGIFVVAPTSFTVEENNTNHDYKSELEDRVTGAWAN